MSDDIDISIFDAAQGNADTLTAGAAPSFAERFAANFEAASRYGTVLGATRDALLPEAETGRASFDAYYDSLPGWQTWDEGLAALSGQFAGTLTGLENYIPLGLGARALQAMGRSGTGIGAKIFAGATDAAVTNATIDSAIQGLEIASDRRDGFSASQLAVSTALGAAAGGAFGGVAGALERRAASAAPDRAAEAPVAPEAAAVTPVAPDQATAASVAPEPPDAALQITIRPEVSGEAAPSSSPAPEARPGPPTIGEQLQLDAEARAAGASPDALLASRDVPPVPDNLDDIAARLAPEGAPVAREAARWVSEAPDAETAAAREAALSGRLDDIEGFDDDFGPVLAGYEGRWAEAVTRLSELAGGEARAVLSRPELGAIDAPWGFWDSASDKGMGIAKIAGKHPEVMTEIPRILAEGELTIGATRATIDTPDARLVLGLDYKGREKTWLMTGYERRSRRVAGTIESRDGRQADSHSSSASPADTTIAADARRVEGSTERNDSLQGDASSPSPADRSVSPGGSPDDGGGLLARPADPREDMRAKRSRTPGNRPASGVAATQDPPTFTRLRDITDRLRDAIAVPASRQGRLGIRGAAGTYNFDSGALRVMRQDDFNTFTHEVGHAVQARFGGLQGAGAGDLLPVMRRFSSELEPMAYRGANPKHLLEEGFAEWFRLAITNPSKAAADAPGFTPEFDQFLRTHAPELPPILDEIRAAYQAWSTQPSGRAVQSTIVSSRRPGWWRKRADSMRRHGIGATIADEVGRAYTSFFDNLHPLQRAVRALANIATEHAGKPIDLKVIDDPYKLARLSRNAHGAGHMDIMHGVTPYRGTNPASPSLRDGIVEAMGAPNVAGRWDDAKGVEFGAYLWSRRALGEWERFRRGDIPNPPDKLSEGDHALHVKEAEAANPQFVTAAAKVHAWALALWDKKLASGLITPEQHADGMKIRDYVPGLRAFDYDGDPVGAGGRGGGDARQSLVKRFQGSTRDVINPLESLMTDAYETAAAIAHNDVMKALDRLSLMAGHGGAAIAERIPAKEMRMLLVDPLEAIEATGRQGGMAAPDVIAIRDMVESLIGNEKAKIFRPAVINTKGETIVFFRDGGQLRAMRLADRDFGMQIYDALTTMSAPEKNLFLDLASVSSSALRAGITSDPAFIMANLIRDQAMASIFYGSPFKRLAGTFRGMADEMLGREAARRYNAAGGIMGGQEVAALRDASVERDLAALRRKGWLSQRLMHLNPVKFIKGAAEVTEISETGMRLGLYKSFYTEAKKRGLADHEAMMEAAWRARDHMDFGRRGSQMAAVSRLVPFLNASLQGFDKVTREMIAPLFGQAATAGEAAARGNAVKAWARLSALTVAGLGLHALMSRHEDYREVSNTTRATHWMVKTGEYWTAIPKPFEMAVVLNAAEAIWDAWSESDPLAASRYLDGLFNVIAPPNLFEGLPGLKFYYEAKTNTDMFTSRPIVPDDLQGMETWLQYTANTSEISKAIGGVIDQPPVMVDQFITSQFGTIGRTVMAMTDMAFGDKPTQGWDEFFLTRRFVKMASRGSTSSREFWDMVSTRSGELEGKAKSYKAIAQAGDDAGAADYLATLDSDQRAYVTVSMMPEGAKRLHPLIRARGAVQSIGWLRRAIADNAVRDQDDNIVRIPSGDRGAADDILSDLAMVEARNALIAVGTEGWQNVKPMPTDGYIRELEAVSPLLKSVLATRYNKAKVWPRELVEGMWPDLRQRLLDDGSQAPWKDLEAEAKAAGVELDGDKATRLPKPAVPGLQ